MMRWQITNRNQETVNGKKGFGSKYTPLTYWSYDPAQPNADITNRDFWKPETAASLKAALVRAAAAFPDTDKDPTAQQKHVTLLIHGYNNAWDKSVELYDTVAKQLYDGPDSLGELVSFDWPSLGQLLGYLPDRATARKVADDLTNVLSVLYDWMETQQTAAQKDPAKACKARTSIIAHSMGNYVLEYATNQVWTRKNRPLLMSLMQEVLMVAADVDNDLFKSGETVTHGDGEGLANLSYRITALYTGRDDVLGASAGLKHFGKRRLGRAGLDPTYPVPDNVWDVDCTTILDPGVNGITIHGEYFNPAETKCYALMRSLLSGVDRSLLVSNGVVPLALPRTQIKATAPAVVLA